MSPGRQCQPVVGGGVKPQDAISGRTLDNESYYRRTATGAILVWTSGDCIGCSLARIDHHRHGTVTDSQVRSVTAVEAHDT